MEYSLVMIDEDKDYEEFTLDEIEFLEDDTSTLYCIEVDSPDHEFLIGTTLVPTHNTDEAKAAQALKGEAASKIGSIARLGRAAGVHLMIATQRPDAKLIPGELKANLGARFACGRMPSTASSMVLDNTHAMETHGVGRAIMQIHGDEEKVQVYFASQSWIDDWLERRGLTPEGNPIKQSSDDDIDVNGMASSVGSGDNDYNELASEVGEEFADRLHKISTDSKQREDEEKSGDDWDAYGGFMNDFMNDDDEDEDNA